MTDAASPSLVERLARTYAKFEHDNHGGYGLCCGNGKVWVDDGMASNYYEGGTCKRCADNSPAPINPDGPEAATAIITLTAEIERLTAERTWRTDFESVPRDKPFLVAYTDGVRQCHYLNNSHLPPWSFAGIIPMTRNAMSWDAKKIAWMPLPPPPSLDQEAGG